jgi:serine phosphatase RsbU (regulator of sigma subunit)
VSGAGVLAPFQTKGFEPRPWLARYSSIVRSVPALDGAAWGHGLISVSPDQDGIIRRVPLVALVGDSMAPALGLEMIRVGEDASFFTLNGDAGTGLETIEIELGQSVLWSIPVRPDGSMSVHFGRPDIRPFISAADVLNGTVDPAPLVGALVLVGVTGIGLQDHWATPTAALMPGIEIHAQVLENIFEGVHLHRPAWALPLELGLLALGGAMMILVLPRASPKVLFLPWPAAMAVMLAVGLGAYLGGQWLVDISTPMVGTSLVFVLVLTLSLIEADRQRRRYRRDLAIQRERDARISGELEAARRIQMGSLPNTRDMSDPLDRFEVHAVLESATDVGGDLYDVFMVDANTLFFLVGDVAGKGIPACLFMALSKSLYKSITLRDGTDIDDVMTIANAELSRDNPEMLFITAWAGLLDLNTGRLAFCNAGHDTPFLLSRSGDLSMLDCEGGPPLCVLDDYTYLKEVRQLSPGDCLILTTDGVSEAMGEDSEMYTYDRVRTLLRTLNPGARARDLVEAVYEDVRTHVGQTDPSDDITILALKWKAPM